MSKISDDIQLKKQQLQIEIQAIRLLMKHPGSKGTEAESAIASLLRKYLPKKFSLGSGFVSMDEKLSPQMDIVIYDEILNAPIFQGDVSGVYRAGAVYGCVEVTMGTLTKKKLEDDIKKHAKLRATTKGCKVKFKNVFSEKHPSGKGTIVKEETFYDTPPPRAYICALSGTNFKTIESLSDAVKSYTKKHGAHIHGLLVIDWKKAKKNEKEWLVRTVPYADYATKHFTTDALYQMIQSMNRSFLGMKVGKFPAADDDENI